MARPKKVKPGDLEPGQATKAIGMKRVGQNYVAYVLTIHDGKVIDTKLSEENLHPIILDMARVFFVDEFMSGDPK